MASSELKFANKMDFIIVMHKHSIIHSGTYSKLSEIIYKMFG